MKSAYPYTNTPPTQILQRNNVSSKTASRILMEQRAAQNVTRKEQVNNQAQNTLQLDELRDTGYHYNLMVAPNAFTTLGSLGVSAPTTTAERDAVLLQQTVDTQKDKLTGLQVGGGKPMAVEGAMELE
jgi:hypothetical protein